jgi:hypothetical protein
MGMGDSMAIGEAMGSGDAAAPPAPASGAGEVTFPAPPPVVLVALAGAQVVGLLYLGACKFNRPRARLQISHVIRPH